MSDEMAVTDSVSSDENKTTSNTVVDASAVDVAETSSDQTIEAVRESPEETSAPAENESVPQLQVDIKVEVDEGDPQEVKDDIPDENVNEPVLDQPQPELETEPVKVEPQANPVTVQSEPEPEPEADLTMVHQEPEPGHGIKRRLSETFSNVMDEEFKGFDQADPDASFVEYQRVLERLETEIQSANKNLIRVKSVVASPLAVSRAAKRPRQDTDGSRPSSGLSSRSDEDGTGSTDGSGRRQSRPLTSPLLRVPLERGWKRELVYRATCDSHMRRNADIYYYTPAGKKLRSMREVSEHLSGTGLSLDNFSFFKDLLGVNDPEKEIIRDAKVRRVESPVSAPPSVEGKRTPKPKPPRGASPQPAIKSPPAKIKVKSLGSRLNNSASSPVQAQQPTTPKQKKAAPAAPAAPTTPADNNNTAAWKKPRQPQPQAAPQAVPHVVPQAVPHVASQAVLHVTPQAAPQAAPHAAPPVTPPPPPPPLQSRPPVLSSPESPISTGRAGVVQPCSMSCGRGAVPSLSCGACLCLYHPACVGRPHHATDAFLCQNCKPLSPSQDPPPLTHKSGMMTNPSLPVPVPKRVPVAPPAPKQKGDQRVLLRMKKSGGAHGQRVWAVSQTTPATTIATPVSQSPVIAPLSFVKQTHVTHTQVTQTQVTPTQVAQSHVTKVTRSVMPQSLAILNGKRFIVVPRSVISANTTKHEKVTRGRLANGAPPPATLSPRRRAPRKADTDHFTPFYRQAEKNNYNVALQIFSYVGMRELARCAQVCRLWRDMVQQPALWRHVRMKNSHVSDWGGLCAALKRHGTKRLDLRKMLLPHNDAHFWEQFATHIPTIDTLERIEMCRCPANAVEAVCRVTGLVSLSALAIRDALLDPTPLAALRDLHELRLKSMAGLSLTGDLRPLKELTSLRHLSLTSIKDLGWCACEVVGDLPLLESLELGECTFRAEFAGVVSRLRHLRRLRLERGTAQCAAPALLRALATLPQLQRLELVNVDVKVGFDDALAECKNIQRLLIIPTYVSQSATTNKQVLSGVLRLKDTLTHLMWGVTIELLRVTELFIDQCDQSGETKKKDIGECIPVLKPVPGCKLPDEHHPVAGPPQVEILPLPTLQRLLSAQMPNTKLKLLRIPFHATWRQTLADFH